MAKVVRSESAKADLLEIWSYIASDDPKAATRFLRKLNSKIRKLSDKPWIRA